MKRKLSPPEENIYLGTTKGSTRMILVHVRITVVVFFVFFQKVKRKLSPPEEKIFRDNKKQVLE